MKIAYLGQMADVTGENGISKKIRAQATRWRQAGHEVRYFSLVPTTSVWPGFDVETELFARGNLVQRVARSRQLADRIRAWRPDAIYFRYAYHSAGFPTLFREIPTVAEINSDDLTEYPLTLSPAKVLYHRLTRARVLRTARGFVTVTRELATRFAGFGHPTETIANGIDLDAFTAPSAPAADAPRRLIFVGSAGTPWHGLERVAELATLLPGTTIDVIGCTAADLPSAPPTLRFHGALTREAYAPLLAAATAAIGTMGLFRKRMDEACPLKVREYLAEGFPVIGGYTDTDIPPDADYFLQLPNNDASLAVRREKIAAWLDHWRDRRVPRAAVAHLDNGVKEARRLAFLAQLVR